MLLLGTKQPRSIERGRGSKPGKMGSLAAVIVERPACRDRQEPVLWPWRRQRKAQAGTKGYRAWTPEEAVVAFPGPFLG